jgi:hypothetical protein
MSYKTYKSLIQFTELLSDIWVSLLTNQKWVFKFPKCLKGVQCLLCGELWAGGGSHPSLAMIESFAVTLTF